MTTRRTFVWALGGRG